MEDGVEEEENIVWSFRNLRFNTDTEDFRGVTGTEGEDIREPTLPFFVPTWASRKPGLLN